MAYKKVKEVRVPYGQMSEIAKHFGITYQAVYNALRFLSESERAAMIRKEAIENYGGQLISVNKKTR